MTITEKTIPGLPKGRHTVDRGLYLLVGATTKTWLFKRRGRWVRIGHWPAWGVAAARQRARELAVNDDLGRALNLDLQQAYNLWLGMKVPRAESTIAIYAAILKNHFGDWLNKPLEKISRPDLVHRHSQIERKAGPSAARNAMIAFASWYRQGRILDPLLPECPTVAVQMAPKRRRDASDLYNRLDEWAKTATPIMMFTLLTGMRRTNVLEAEWSHVVDGRLHIPRPKRARGADFSPYEIPLLDCHLELLGPRGTGRLFKGPLRGNGEWTPHALRHCFVTAAVDANVHPFTIARLVNHSVPNMTGHYVGRHVDLREAMERICGVLQSKCHHASLNGQAPPP